MLDRVEDRVKALPAPVKQGLKRASRVADPFQRWTYRQRTGEAFPIPPAELRARVGSGVQIESYIGEGRRLRRAIYDALADQGVDTRQLRSFYDWGCGCGRLLTHLHDILGPRTEIVASDVDAEAVAWAARAWPHMRIVVNGFSPPLPVGEGSISCLVSSSILTHLSEPDQDRWLEEVRRVLEPGGHALITTQGLPAFEHSRRQEQRTRSAEYSARLASLPPLAGHGFLFEPYDRRVGEARDFPGIEGEYGMAFHHPDYVREHWGRWLDVVDHREAAVNNLQDLVVLRRPG